MAFKYFDYSVFCVHKLLERQTLCFDIYELGMNSGVTGFLYFVRLQVFQRTDLSS
jgi:hypothetical protein